MRSLLFIAVCALMTYSAAAQAETSAMAKEQTLSIIKPNAVAANHVGEIITRFEKAGLKVVAIKMETLDKKRAQDFYAEHKERPFFPDLIQFMTSGPVVVMVLQGDHAVAKNRELMGATDPSAAAKGTIRADFGKSKTENAVHGSDSAQSAEREISFFFKPSEIADR